MIAFAIRRAIRPRRLIEAALVIAIGVAYLLVVTRGQIISALAGSTPYPAASSAPYPTHATPSHGEPTP